MVLGLGYYLYTRGDNKKSLQEDKRVGNYHHDK